MPSNKITYFGWWVPDFTTLWDKTWNKVVVPYVFFLKLDP